MAFQAIPLDGKEFSVFDVRDNKKSAMATATLRTQSGVLRGPFAGRFEVRGTKLFYDSTEITVTFRGKSDFVLLAPPTNADL